MGFLDRLKDVAEGVGSAMTAPIEFSYDVARGALTDHEIRLWGEFKQEAGEALEGVFGPDKGLGAAIGGLPEGHRRAVSFGVGKVSEAADWAYGVTSRALARGVAQQSTRSNVGGGPFRSTVYLDTKRGLERADEIVQGHSPGEMIVLASTTNVWSDKSIEEREADPWFHVASGTADALLRLSPLDPLNSVGKVAQVGRVRYLNTPIRNIDEAMDTRRVARFIQKIEGLDAAQIRHQFFPNHESGAAISTILAAAPDREARTLALRGLMGDGDSLALLAERHADIDHQIGNLVSDQAMEWGDNTLFSDPARRAQIEKELDALYGERDEVVRAVEASGTVREVPRYSRTADVRARVSASHTYQHSALTKPLRVFTNRVPHSWLDLNDPRSDIQIARQLRGSALPEAEQAAWRERYMAAVNPAQRQQVAVEAENAMVRATLDAHGISNEAIDAVMAQARGGRERAMGALRNRRYDAEGRGSIRFEDVDGQTVEIHLPLHITQTADLLPLADMKELDRLASAYTRQGVAGKARAFGVAHPATDWPEEVLEGFYRVWRPSVLLRFAWPLRVGMDEQLRIVSEIGLLKTLSQWPRGFRQIGDRAASAVGRRIPGVKGAEVVGREAVERRALERLDETVEAAGIEFPSAFGAPGDAANAFVQGASARTTMRTLVEGERARILGDLRKHTGRFRTIIADDVDNYRGAYEWAVNKHIRQSAMAREFIEGRSVDDVVDWLRTSDEGIEYARRMGWRPHTFRAHAEDVEDQINRYLPDDLKVIARDRDVTYDDLASAIPDVKARPPVHGEDLLQATGTSNLLASIRKVTADAFDALGTLPTDALARQPFFAHHYRQEVARLADIAEAEARKAGRTLGQADVDRIALNARRYALDKTQALLYDLAERSELTELMRFTAPFFGAWQEVMVTWPRQGVRNPQFVAQMRQVWSAPERNGLVTDENGNVVSVSGGATNPLTGEKVEAGSERYITLPFQIPGLPTKGPVSFNKKSMNLILTGSPGFGPVVQVPVNEIVKDRPRLAESVDFILPFGSTQEIKNLLLPAVARRFNTALDQEDDRVYRNTMIRMYYDRLVDYRLGKRDEPPTLEEVKRDTDSLFHMRTAASWIAPFAPIFDSPYKPWIDTYRQAQERVRNDPDAIAGQSMLLADDDGNPRSADEWFYDTFGSEYFPLVQSLSSSRDGVPPTVEAYEARSKYADLINAHPDLGGLIIGAEGAGEFSRSVYDAQLANPLAPGSSEKQRESPSFNEAMAKPGVSEGWLQFGRAMDLIDSARVARGLPNLSVAGARDLAAMKTAVTEALAAKFPEWWAEYNVTDRAKWDRRITGLREVAADERLGKRTEIQGLRVYLQARDVVLRALAARGGRLDSTANMDLALVWEAIKAKLVEQNLAFSDLFYRFLDRDPMTTDTLEEAA